MRTELVDISPTRKEIKIDIDAAEVRAQYNRVSDRYARSAAVPGFRPGRAPSSVIKRHYKNEIRSEVLRELLPQAVADALEEHKLNPLVEPEIQLSNTEGLEKIGEEDLSIQAQVEVLPEVTLGEYKGLEVTRRTRPVTDADVDRVVEALRQESASLQAVEDRGAQLGDTLTVTFRGKFVEEPEAEEINVEDVEVVLGGPHVLPEISENLVGVKPDEERNFTVKYPEDFNSPGLAGKTIDYNARTTAVLMTELPEVDDEWAKSVGEGAETVAALREQIREGMTENSRQSAENVLREELMNKLIGAHTVEVPDTLVESQTQRLLESSVYEMMQRGYDPRGKDIQWEPLRNLLRGRAEQELRGSLLLERIAEAEKVEVSDEQVNEEINRLAESLGQTPEQVRAALTKQGGERSIADRLRVRRTIDFLVENARVTEGEWHEEEPAAEAASSSGDPVEQENAEAHAASPTTPENTQT